MDVSAIIIGWNNEGACARRAKALREAAAAYDLDMQLIAVDNSLRPLDSLPVLADTYIRNAEHPWAGPAIWKGAHAADAEILVYVCSQHFVMKHKNWLLALTSPVHAWLTRDPGAALVGDLRPISFGPVALGMGDTYDDTDPKYRQHIQGGVWAGVTATVREIGWSEKFPHGYEDVVRSWAFLKRGLPLGHVKSICSIGRRGEVCHNEDAYSAIHDYRSGQG